VKVTIQRQGGGIKLDLWGCAVHVRCIKLLP
jgi:hypothetical protein